MKIKFLVLALLPFALTACQSTPLSDSIQNVGDLALTVLQQPNADQTLSSYHWSTNTGASKPLVLTFDPKGRLFISTSCNNLATGWVIANQKIVTGNVAATMMACPEKETQQELLAQRIFANSQIDFKLNVSDRLNPTLTLTAADGQSYVFTGKMTPEAKYQSQGEIIFLEIAPQLQTCSSNTGQCLQVREIKYANNGVKLPVESTWTSFHSPIEGFEHNLHESQIIRVKRYEIPKPAADQSKYAYILDMVVERRTAK